MDMNSARLELTPSNPESGIVTIYLTILPKILILTFRGARQTRDTPHTCTAQSREAVMADDGS